MEIGEDQYREIKIGAQSRSSLSVECPDKLSKFTPNCSDKLTIAFKISGPCFEPPLLETSFRDGLNIA